MLSSPRAHLKATIDVAGHRGGSMTWELQLPKCSKLELHWTSSLVYWLVASV